MSRMLATNDEYIERLIADNRYEIRADGTIWTTVLITGKNSKNLDWRKLSVRRSSSGHLSIKYRKKHLALHRVIYRRFNGPLRAELAVNHIDGNKENNTPLNLELITHSEYMLHCFRVLGHIPLKPRSKITFAIAEEIRRDQAAGRTYRELRVRYGLSKSSISLIVNRKTWTNDTAARKLTNS